MSQAIEFLSVPSSVQDKLRRIRRRQVAVTMVRGVAFGMAVLIATMLIAMLIDGVLNLFSPGLCAGLTAASIMASVGVLIATGVRPVRELLGWTQAAGVADQGVPQLEQRWTTVTESSSDRSHNDTYQAMLSQVTSEAVAIGSLVDPGKVVQRRPAKQALAVLACCCAGLLLVLAANWPRTSILLKRFWSFGGNITATSVHSLAGDLAVPRGDAATIEIETSGLATETAQVFVARGVDPPEVFQVDARNVRHFTHTFPPVQDDFAYRVRSGDGQTPWHRVSVLNRPSIQSVRMIIDVPAYVDRPRYEKHHLPSRVKAIEGSQLTLEVSPDISIARMELSLTRFSSDDEEPHTQTLSLSAAADGTYRYRTMLLENLVVRPTLISHDGLSNLDDSACRIQVIEDKAPVARVISPTEEVEVDPEESLEIKFEVHDDHGIAKVELVVSEETADGELKVLRVEEIPLGDQRLEKHIVSSVELDLSEFDLDDDAKISYAIRVTDNRSLAKDGMSNQDEQSNLLARKSKTQEAETQEDAAQQNAASADRSLTAESHEADQAIASDDDHSDSRDERSRGEKTAGADAANPDPGFDSLASKQPEPAADTDPTSTPDAEAIGSKAEPGTPSPPVGPNDRETDIDDRGIESLASAAEAKDQANPANRADSAKPNGEPADEMSSQDQLVMNEPSGREQGQPSSPASATQANVNHENQPSPSQRTLIDQLAAADLPLSPIEEMSESAQRDMLRRLLDLKSGQGSTSIRIRVKIRDRVRVEDQAMQDGSKSQMVVREDLETIDAALAIAETMLSEVSNDVGKPNESPVRRGEQLNEADAQLKSVSGVVTTMHQESRETPFAFIGLQLVNMGRTHITPARDRVLWVKRNPDESQEGGRLKIKSLEALHHITQARDFLAGVMQRIEMQDRDKKLADGMDEVATMYEIYIENTLKLLRQSGQSRNPLKRKMAVMEVDEAYLARRTEIEELRRDMMAEFARLLADDPRLLRRYLDTIRRRQTSLRDRLTEASERQADIADEVSAWLQVDETRREDLWRILVDARLEQAVLLATDASALADRTEAQMPLDLETNRGTPATVIERAGNFAIAAQDVALIARHQLETSTSTTPGKTAMANAARVLCQRVSSLIAALERLDFETRESEDTRAFLAERLAEANEFAQRSDQWRSLAIGIEHNHYHPIAASEQQQLSQATTSLRVDLDELESGLENLFRRDEIELPEEIRALAVETRSVMEAITMHQSAAVYCLTTNAVDAASEQLQMAVERFQQAEDLFDRIRRMTVDVLDEQEVDNPNVADLREPTLDEFLARLEREPRLVQQLELGNRQTNLRVLSDWMLWQQRNSAAGSMPMQQMAQRARKRMEEMKQQDKQPAERTPRERKEETENLREMLAQSIQRLEAAAADPEIADDEAKEIRERARQLKRMLDRQDKEGVAQWSALAESDRARAMLRRLASGEKLPDQQWNKLFSSLENGLWQVRGRTPPEAYRRAIEQYQEIIRQSVQ